MNQHFTPEQWIAFVVCLLAACLIAFAIFVAPFIVSSKCSRQEEAEEDAERRRKQNGKPI